MKVLTGIGIYRYEEVLLNVKTTILILSIFFISVVIRQMIWFGYFSVQEKYSVSGLTVGIFGALLLFRLKLKSNLLIRIGGYAYGTFLFHVFFTAGSLIILMKRGVENQLAILISGGLSAIFLSILVETLIRKSAVLCFYFLGLRKNEK